MKSGFFQDHKGNLSTNRLVFIVGMAWLMGITSFVIISRPQTDIISVGAFFSTIAIILYGGKVGQKAIENKTPEA